MDYHHLSASVFTDLRRLDQRRFLNWRMLVALAVNAALWVGIAQLLELAL